MEELSAPESEVERRRRELLERIKHEQLKRLRVQAGWTQEEIAAKCRIDVRTYRKYERGEVRYTHRADTRETSAYLHAQIGGLLRELVDEQEPTRGVRCRHDAMIRV